MKLKPLDEVLPMHNEYMKGIPTRDIAKKYNYADPASVLHHFRKFNLYVKPHPRGAIKQSQKASENGNWKGGRNYSKKHGWRIHMPNHPNSGKQGYIYEYILIASNVLGRPLKYGEVVHHVDGNRDNNNNNNLLICTNSYHSSLHWRIRKGENNGSYRCL